MSLRNKLVGILVLTSILVLGIFAGLYLVSDIKSYRQRKVESLTALAQMIGTNTVSAIRFLDNEHANASLAELRHTEPMILQAEILDKNGNVFAEYTSVGTDSLPIPSAAMTESPVFANGDVYVSKKIVADEERLGSVVIRADLSDLAEIKRTEFRLAALSMIVAIAFALLVAVIVQKYISRRLLRLVDTMNQVGETADYTRTIPETGNDEIGVLTKVFNHLLAQIRKNQQRRDEFIAVASHELKTPLTNIKGYVQLLREIEDRDPASSFVQRALENINKLENLVKDLLDVTRIQSGQLELNLKNFSLEELIGETIASLQNVVKTHTIVRQPCCDGELVFADRQRIEQVLLNLLSNAIKYSPDAKEVIVTTAKVDGEFQVKVRDFGMGVPVKERANIFERFYRIGDRPENISGFGLGLYICRDIILRHNGRIWIEDAEKGSFFCFSLPVPPGKADQDDEPSGGK